MVSEHIQTEAWTLSFGRYLKAIRVQQGIPLEAVARKICVSVSQLELIEAEDLGRLSDDVYLRGTLRAYAKCVGVDPDDIVERYTINRAAFERGLRAGGENPKSGRRAFSRIMVILGGIFAIVVFSRAAISFFPAVLSPLKSSTISQGFENHVNKLMHNSRNAPAALPVHGQSPAGTAEKTAHPFSRQVRQPALQPSPHRTDAAADTTSRPVKPVKLTLQIDAVADTTINAQIDGVRYKTYHLHANDHIELEADSRFNLLISNPSGVKLSLNGHPVPLPGEPGHAVNITLPAG